VELQAARSDFERAGVTLFAISYDPVPILAAFAEQHGISFRLLSDEGSVVIRRLGLLNEHQDAQNAAYGLSVRDDRRGVPYPGTFVLDRDGVITAKHFEQSFRARPTAAMMREWAPGLQPLPPATVVQASARPGLEAQAWTDAPTYRPYQQLRLHVQLDMPDGSHVCGQPTPDGYTPLSLEIQPMEGLTIEPVEFPDPQPFQVEGLDEAFLVYEHRFEAVIPFFFTSNLGEVNLDLRIGYQECSGVTCFPPAEIRLTLPLAGLDLIRN
jgi:peroxiredoxin